MHEEVKHFCALKLEIRHYINWFLQLQDAF